MATTKQKHRRTTKNKQVPTKNVFERLAKVEAEMLRKDLPGFQSGDTLRVMVRIKEGEKERLQAFEGLCIGRSNKGASKSFRVRKISHGVGVERIFLDSSPKVAKVEIVQKGKVRRAKLYYIRELEGKAAKIDREIELAATGATASAPAAKPAK